MTPVFGRHYLVECIGCDPEPLRRVEDVRPQFLDAVAKSGATVVAHHFHQFVPHGVSGMVFISESHFSLHTWPECGYVALDILTCGRMDPRKAISFLKEVWNASETRIRVMARGF